MVMGKAAVFVEPYHFEMTELPPVPVEAGGIRVKVTSGGICGSDLHLWRGEIKPIMDGKQGPVILGHELAGVVDTLGPDISTDSMGRPLKEGDRVAFAYFFPCRRCYNCLRGELNHCPRRFRFRASIEEFPYCNGGFAEYYYLFPGHFVFKVPDELPDEAVAVANCAAAQVVYGLHQAGMRMGDYVVVQGAGGLGINAVAAAKEMGAGQVISIDGVPGRLELARQCGADHTIDINEYATPESRVERVKELTDGRGADVVMEVVGYPNVVPEGIEMVRRGGTYVEIGNIWPNSNVTLDVSKVLWGQVRIIPATHYDPYILPVTLDFLARTKDKYPLTKVMSHSFPLEKIGEAFEAAEWAGKSEGTQVTRALVTP
jgi:threonine dehydrogenase-like Zn-dependent dehydrogenase